MKLQNLAVMFVIIILPISVVLANYTASKVDTLRLQISYDEKLDNSTADAVKAFQINTFNGDESVLANYKIENIEAAVNAFYTSVRSNFGMSGYNNKSIEEFIPAVVFILYDGYYIYSQYTNTWDEETNTITDYYNQSGGTPTYSNDQSLFGLKPYIYYSCRYVKGTLDVVITYSLDNYITIKGVDGDTVIDQKGYLLSGVNKNEAGNYTYNGIEITSKETLYETLNVNGTEQVYPYRKINGVKYYIDIYKDTPEDRVFSFFNGVKQTAAAVTEEQIVNNDNAVKYYEEAWNLKDFILNSDLKDLKASDAQLVTNQNSEGTTKLVASEIFGTGEIFAELSNDDPDRENYIEEEDSVFNSHRMDVIKYTVERNLSVAISNFNSSSTYNFRMPELMPDEWDIVANNITMITFLQGLPIGSKIYNGYSVIANNRNKEMVADDDIYIVTQGDLTYHDIRDAELYDDTTYNFGNAIGRYSMDFERETIVSKNNADTFTYFPAFLVGSNATKLTSCYGSIVTRRNLKDGTIFDIVRNGDRTLQKIYYTALGRERYGLYRVENNITDDDLENRVDGT